MWEVKELCWDTVWGSAVKEREGEESCLIPGASSYCTSGKEKQDGKFPTLVKAGDGRHHPHREPGCQRGGRSGCKQSELSWLAQGRSRDKTILCQGLCFAQHHLAGTQMERISLAGRRASQIQYLSTLPHPVLGLS